MTKNYIELEFTLRANIFNNPSLQEEMVKWCKDRQMKMEVQQIPWDFAIKARIKFFRDENTYNFIKKFLESQVQHALPYKSLETIPDVTVVRSE